MKCNVAFTIERPSQPVNFNIVCKDDTSLTLSWGISASTNEEANHFVVSIYYSMLSIEYNYGSSTTLSTAIPLSVNI